MCKEGLLKTNISQGDLSLFPLILVLGIVSFKGTLSSPHLPFIKTNKNIVLL